MGDGCGKAAVLSAALLALLSVGRVDGHYTKQWAVHITDGADVADRIAAKHGFRNMGEIFENHYHFEHQNIHKRSLHPATEHHRNLIQEPQVVWAKQQIVKRRQKRDLVPLRPSSLRSKQRADSLRFNDVRWPYMWYLNRGAELDMNVQGAWTEGITGKGIVVTILDDGLEKDHPDLTNNYDPLASYDVNNHDEDPQPRYDIIDSNRHGTRCAGEVAAIANNSICSVGVAYGASVGGVRMLDGDVTDAVEARSLSLYPQHIDIYSASWGPDDDGKTVDGPGELATRAFIEGVTKGRQGKGSIFVWASGNGGRDLDNCNCDGYTNSIWTLSISSATEQGLVPWYSEACSSTLATTYSSGSAGEKQIVTTDLHHGCTGSHTGTSASAPLAAGICALALEANPQLTWRDMQHIVVRTARPANLKSPDWKVNGVGRNVSHSFGYGLMDASAMVTVARTWKTVPEQHRCEVSAPHVDKLIPPRSKVILNLTVTECYGVNFLEHVQAKISLSSSRRGDLQIYLTSPAGTRATLLAKRPQDGSRIPFSNWPFMSVHTWGEMPFGIWQLEIHNEGRFLGLATLQEWSLLLYGTALIPGVPPKLVQKSPSIKIQNSNRKKVKEKGVSKVAVAATAAANLTLSYKVPAAFQKYPKVQQLFPVYVTSVRKSEELLSRNGNSLVVVQKAERQDPASASASQSRQKPKKPPSRNQIKAKAKALQKKNNPSNVQRGPQGRGNFDGWQMVLYGTAEAPNSDSTTSLLPTHQSHANANAPLSNLDVSNHVDAPLDAGPGGVKDPRHQPQSTTAPSYSAVSSATLPTARECTENSYQNGSLCEPCHYTCLTCSGPKPHNCLSCQSDAIFVLSGNSRHCLPSALGNIYNWYYYMWVAFTLNSLLLLGIIVWLLCKRCRSRRSYLWQNMNIDPPLKAELDKIVYHSSSDDE